MHYRVDLLGWADWSILWKHNTPVNQEGSFFFTWVSFGLKMANHEKYAAHWSLMKMAMILWLILDQVCKYRQNKVRLQWAASNVAKSAALISLFMFDLLLTNLLTANAFPNTLHRCLAEKPQKQWCCLFPLWLSSNHTRLPEMTVVFTKAQYSGWCCLELTNTHKSLVSVCNFNNATFFTFWSKSPSNWESSSKYSVIPMQSHKHAIANFLIYAPAIQ